MLQGISYDDKEQIKSEHQKKLQEMSINESYVGAAYRCKDEVHNPQKRGANGCSPDAFY